MSEQSLDKANVTAVQIQDPGFQISENGTFPERSAPRSISNTPEEFRSELAKWIYRESVGPSIEGFDEVEYLKIPPNQIYTAGVLFPQNMAVSELEDVEVSEGMADVESTAEDLDSTNRKSYRDEGLEDEELNLANAYRQSAIGLSFAVPLSTDSVRIQIFAAKYEAISVDTVAGKPVENQFEKQRYRRVALVPEPMTVDLTSLNSNEPIKTEISNLDLKVKRRRQSQDVMLVTVSMFNTRQASHTDSINFSDCYYQCSLALSLPNGNAFEPLRKVSRTSSRDDEELQLDLLYRDRKSFALGHGCAVEWDTDNDAPINLVTTSLPSFKVPPVVPREGGEHRHYAMTQYSSLSLLSNNEVLELLDNVPAEYEQWIDEQRISLNSLQPEHAQPALDNLNKCTGMLNRIRKGIALLTDDKVAMEAFRLMNRAMIAQQIHYARPMRKLDEDWVELDESYENLKPYQGKWRVFQLAFVLANLSGAHRSLDLDERSLVDLIWFPTGGGKTEAYLGLSAFTVFYRRLINPEDSGCTVLMRYTLRLLTVQQFQRAAAMICACEQIRHENEQKLGVEEISIGLWVGDSLTPNKKSAARQLVRKLVQGDRVENKFQLLKCPWCGTALDDQHSRKLGYVPIKGSVEFLCPEHRCNFSKKTKRRLPVVVIDEDIYKRPPTLIIGTVDKFAMLAWNESAGVIFGRGVGVSPPDLIIQDELHLISGPVGTMVGLYESAIDLLCEDAEGVGAKIVGSTATIRRATQQCRALYDREITQFPPSGISASDNFFSYEKRDDPGRVYLGVCPLSASSFVTGMVRAFSSALEGVSALECSAEKEEYIRDGYWTLVKYFNSLRELGRGVTLLQQDIPEWSNIRARARGAASRRLYRDDELTSRKTSEEIPKILEDLNVSWSKDHEKGAKRAYDAVLATNMISVGVDIDRLGLMAIVGQPKTTSEYIQASSRVGRKNHPGLVLACYNPAKPRDRSHFETFTRYHSSLYRWVEPTSVTPFSIPALEKGLHALVIILARHFVGVKKPSELEECESNLDGLFERIVERCRSIETTHAERSLEVEEMLAQIWERMAASRSEEWGGMGIPNREDEPLMVVYGQEHLAEDAFVTPTSLRGVDVECEVVVSVPMLEIEENSSGNDDV